MRSWLKRILGHLGLAPAAFRFRERWRSLRRGKRPAPSADGLPIPPARLIVLVTGSADATWYTEGGKLGAESICRTLTDAGVPIAHFQSIFDFGCGCGRVIRHWRPLTSARLHGADQNPDLVAWCRQNLAFAEFQSNTLEPRLDYADQKFEFAYALSVFTHMPEDLQQPWMSELWRILRPGGYLLITTQGDEYLQKLTETERANYGAGRIVVRYRQAAGSNLCSVYHPEPYVRQRLQGRFSMVLSRPRGAAGNGNQDIYLLRKPQ
ncbi:MAG TPA: class I SAM-dependent methyltransferase [Bryobacteraceae bacterium]|nr:class I SAM-dependent methyltransferase [Bryobacteraceae bacterium]